MIQPKQNNKFKFEAGIDMFVILNNGSTWIQMKKKTMRRLEDLQLNYIRLMLQVPAKGTPKVALLTESGLLSMKHHIWMKN